MADFSFLKNPISKKWVISAPRRAKRPDVAKGTEPVCPFCVGREGNDPEVYRIPASEVKKTHESIWPAATAMTEASWSVRVITNKYPFAPFHEVVIHSPDHHKNFDTLPVDQTERIIKTYRHRYNEHHRHGQVYIFHNHGQQGGESLNHPHTQLAVMPEKVYLDIPRLESVAKDMPGGLTIQHFTIFCPETSQWPDEVWIAPKRQGTIFGEVTDDEVNDLSIILSTLIHLYDLRHGNEFPFNFYIYPGGDWYLRIIPRVKTLGGFEVGTGVMVNTQKPQETMEFIKEHFHEPNVEKILREHQAEYHKAV